MDATGRDRSLARLVEPRASKRPATSVAFKTHLHGALVPYGVCELYAFQGGYGDCNKVENDVHNCCFIISSREVRRLGNDPERVWRETVLSNSRAALTMGTAVAVKPWLAVPIQGYGRRPLVPAKGLISIGDSAAFIDPFTGSGILLALESAKIAAEAVVDHFAAGSGFEDLAATYNRRYSARFDRRLLACKALRLTFTASVPFAAEAAITLLASSNRLRQVVARATRSNAERAA